MIAPSHNWGPTTMTAEELMGLRLQLRKNHRPVPYEFLCLAKRCVLFALFSCGFGLAVPNPRRTNPSNRQCSDCTFFRGKNYWGHAPARPVPFGVVKCLAYINESWCSFFGKALLSPFLAQVNLNYTQRSYVFSNK